LKEFNEISHYLSAVLTLLFIYVERLHLGCLVMDKKLRSATTKCLLLTSVKYDPGGVVYAVDD